MGRLTQVSAVRSPWRPSLRPTYALVWAIGATTWVLLTATAAAGAGTLDLTLTARIDGTAPLDADDTPGNDSSTTNGIVRSQDLVTWTWSISMAGLGTDPAPTEVVLTQHLGSPDGAVAAFTALPSMCGIGTNPATGVAYNPQSSLSDDLLTCNVGELRDGETIDVSTEALVSGRSEHGATLNSSQSIEAFDAAGATAVTSTPLVDPAATDTVISAAPRFDLDVERAPWIAGVEFHDGELGYRLVYWTGLRSTTRRGIEQLPSAFGWTAALDATVPGAIANARIFNAADNCKRVSDTQSTVPDGAGGGPTAVTHSGTMSCTQLAHGAPVSVVIDGADTTGDHVPTTAPRNLFGFPNFSNGPFYLGTYISQWFVPLSDIVAAGSVDVVFCLSDFDPVSASGQSNFAAGYEPGWDGATASGDNCTAPTTLTTNLAFDNDTRFITTTAVGGGFLCCDPTFYVPGQTNGRTGDGVVEPGDRFMAMQPMHNTGTEAVSNFVSCLAFDNSVLRAAPIDPSPNPWAGSTEVARLSLMATASGHDTDYVLEFAGGGNAGAPGGWNNDLLVAGPVAGRHIGEFTDQVAATCNDGDADPSWGWTTATELDDPAGIPLDEITKLRVRLADPTSYQVPGGAVIRPRIGLVARSTFFGGPDDGARIPPGVVLATTSAWRVAELNGGDWSTSDYEPNSHAGEAGDRLGAGGTVAPPVPTTSPTTTAPPPPAPAPSTTTTPQPTAPAPESESTTTAPADSGVADEGAERGPSGPLALTGEDTTRLLQGALALIIVGLIALAAARSFRHRRIPTNSDPRAHHR